MPLITDPELLLGGLTEVALDPSEVATARTELALNDGNMRIAKPGPDWGDAQVQAYMAEVFRGELPVDYRIPNRQVKIPLIVGADVESAFTDVKASLQQKVALIQREGGWLRRGTGLYADVVNATLSFPDELGWLGVQADVVLTLECLPDFYGDEVALPDHTETALPELVFTETDIRGDYPARLRLVVDNDGDADWLGLTAAVRCRHYSDADTARLAYEAEDLTPLDTTVSAPLDGASGTATLRHAELATVWTPVMSTNLADGTYLTHTGSYRVEARIVCSEDVDAVRLVWGVGDLTNSVENDPATGFTSNGFYDVILGDVRLDAPPVGDHRWEGRIQAKASPDAAGPADIYVDRLTFIPLDEGWAEVSAPRTASGSFEAFSARDEFDTETDIGDPLDGRTAPLGGDWATSGATTDFELAYSPANISHVFRDTSSDAGPRLALLGTDDYGVADFQGDFMWEGEGVVTFGLWARVVDTTNYLLGSLELNGSEVSLMLTPLVAGDDSAAVSSDPVAVSAGELYTLRLRAGDGVATLTLLAGEAIVESISVVSDGLAAGGAIETGQVGLYDRALTGTATRRFSSLYVTEPAPDAAVFAGQSCQLGTDGNWREDPAGEAYGPVADESGDLLRLPPSGVEGRTVELLVKPDRAGFETLPVSAIDDVSARAYIRPSYLFP